MKDHIILFQENCILSDGRINRGTFLVLCKDSNNRFYFAEMGKDNVYYAQYSELYQQIKTKYIEDNLKDGNNGYYLNFSYIASVGSLFDDLRPLTIIKLVRDIH